AVEYLTGHISRGLLRRRAGRGGASGGDSPAQATRCQAPATTTAATEESCSRRRGGWRALASPYAVEEHQRLRTPLLPLHDRRRPLRRAARLPHPQAHQESRPRGPHRDRARAQDLPPLHHPPQARRRPVRQRQRQGQRPLRRRGDPPLQRDGPGAGGPRPARRLARVDRERGDAVCTRDGQHEPPDAVRALRRTGPVAEGRPAAR
ncbi:hypothetical protein LTR53_018493, partial [Teratosphaeriaceae sp. CCFEE 6253]